MAPRANWLWLTALSTCGTLCALVSAHAISMEKDRRIAPSESTRGQMSATGLVRCGPATGTAQLTVRNDVITTAAHVLVDEHGRRRTGCVFEPTMAGGGAVAIDVGSIRTGSTMPLSERATRDWAVARLVAPVKGVTPYGLGSPSTAPAAVVMCAGGNKAHTAMGTEHCSTRRVLGTSSDGIREIAIDCNAGPGSSGAALVAQHKVIGIYVGYRSSDPGQARSYSDQHYNFAITIDGPFRRELMAAAQR
jgi:V8-like Glu-specific endopeptidase